MKSDPFLAVLGILFFLINGCAATSKEAIQQAERSGYHLITVSELKALIDTGMDVLIIDTLPGKNFSAQHIPGALNFPFPNPEMSKWEPSKTDGKSKEDFIAFLGSNRDKPLIFYCWDAK